MFDRPRPTAGSAKGRRSGGKQAAVPGLPNDVVVTHILGAIDDPIHLARLRAVSRAMRVAVAVTGRALEVSDEEAAELGYLHTLKNKRRKGLLRSGKDLCKAAARGGQLETLKWLHAIGCEWGRSDPDPWSDPGVCGLAAKRGDLEMLRWAREKKCPWDEHTFTHAASGGNFELLEWMFARGCKWNSDVCEAAALKNLEVLKWARERNCPWNWETVAGAAQVGHIDVLEWARANGAEWNVEACTRAAAFGQFETLKWLRAQTPPCPWNAFTSAFAAKYPEIQRWARDNGCPWSESLAASSRRLDNGSDASEVAEELVSHELRGQNFSEVVIWNADDLPPSLRARVQQMILDEHDA